MTRQDTTKEWQALITHQAETSSDTLNSLFDDDPQRFDNFTLQAANLLFDYSKNNITKETITLLLALADSCDLQQAIKAMYTGEEINNTEKRQVLHTALRSPNKDSIQEKQVHQTLDKMQNFVESILHGDWQGYTGAKITDIVNIGIGGSDLGPAMVYEALTPYHNSQLTCHFVSNIDPNHISQTLAKLNPATTLFIVASKSFNTLETLKNSEFARRWFLDSVVDESALAKHFVAVSSNIEKAKAFGIAETSIFPLWDWVGGRYSLWSAIGLPVALGIGMSNFRSLLQGAAKMDQHFETTPFDSNIPVLMGLLNVWHLNFCSAKTQVILPYYQNLHLFPAYLQQVDMESLGKSFQRDGSPVTGSTGGIVWGSAGTNGQHSFHQLLHQGTHLIPADFIAIANNPQANEEQHQYLLANCFAQSQGLMQGKNMAVVESELKEQGLNQQQIEQLAPHKVFAGNKPSNTIMLDKLTPESLGSLIAAYEHKVYVQSVILGINAFDQWGVELGKVLSLDVFDALSNSSLNVSKQATFDSSTHGLVNYCK